MTEDRQKILAEGEALPVKAEGMAIQSNGDLETAVTFLTTIKALRQKIDSVFNPMVQKAHAAHKEVLKQKKEADAPLVKAEAVIKPKIAVYNRKLEQERQAEVKRLQDEADAKAKVEREAQRKKEETERLAAAEKAEEEGASQDQVEEILDTPTPVPEVVPEPVFVPDLAPVMSGVSVRKKWDYRVTDLSKVPVEYLQLNTKMVGGVVRSMKDATNIPGIEVFSEDVVSAQARG